MKITNPNKILFPNDNIKKIDVITYYYDIAELIMPHIKNRVLSVIKCHQNIEKEVFIKKHPSNDKNNMNIIEIKGEEYFYINKKKELLYQVQNGVIEFHIGEATIKDLNMPNFMVFDLDPDEDLSLKKVREATKKLKSVLDELNMKSYLKTSGGKGYHVVVPFKDKISYDELYSLTKKIALFAETRWPNIFTTNIKKDKRKGKIFIDYLRNNKGATCVAPYSLRARKKATISMPIGWDNLDKISPDEINIKNYKKYIDNSWDDFNSKQTVLIKKRIKRA